ncbi:hypothetical protein HanIR_Chr04g0159371 [Helianthus annuus]|nr:hypothetical protein HanIR_Chr04g0159371 [Helianthus annuus]
MPCHILNVSLSNSFWLLNMYDSIGLILVQYNPEDKASNCSTMVVTIFSIVFKAEQISSGSTRI